MTNEPENIALAASVIRNGGVVAFGTETVYGLGADAYNDAAVKKIFRIKGRPSDNPLIVHVCDGAQISGLAAAVPKNARILIDKFMPGPITLVLNKRGRVSDAVTAGLPTVAVRMPSDKTALAFISACGVPVAAPSANISGRPSPTTAKHVYDDLNGKIGYILDCGECAVGVESTVVDARADVPVILRSGGVPIEQIERAVGKAALYTPAQNQNVPPSPGMKYRHYAPKAAVLFSAFHSDMRKTISAYYDRLAAVGVKPVILCFDSAKRLYGGRETISVGGDNADYARRLFAALREADERNFGAVIAEGVSDKGLGAAVINRLIKAAGGRII
ncbi:MAG: threonylcarbamoyl-AMP synthase [Clostridiales bacterium]|nr:threonylcarbamoyl-AMP synthase [Clostridiales bacterium]